jgi:hypothetical protein
VFHGFSMNGAVMRDHLGELTERIPAGYEVIYASAPHACPEESVQRLYGAWGTERLPGPYLRWWDATDDGREYRGWDETRAYVQGLLEQYPDAGILGFSQGAILSAAVAALSAGGALPRVAFAILVAGRKPRSDVVVPFFEHPVAVQSLHVWGEADPLALGSAELSEGFAAETREVVKWPGSHRVPARGPAADALVRFLEARGQ